MATFPGPGLPPGIVDVRSSARHSGRRGAESSGLRAAQSTAPPRPSRSRRGPRPSSPSVTPREDRELRDGGTTVTQLQSSTIGRSFAILHGGKSLLSCR